MEGANKVIVFDGVCNLCNGFIDFIIHRDKGTFKFAALQTPVGKSLVPQSQDETVYLVIGERIYNKSTAALMVARHLKFPWFLFSIFLIVPKIIRDAIYNWVARNRYKWFGKRDTCRLPTPEERARFL